MATEVGAKPTERQLEYLKYAARGFTDAEIGRFLKVKECTSGNMLIEIGNRFGVRGRTRLALEGIMQQCIQSPEVVEEEKFDRLGLLTAYELDTFQALAYTISPEGPTTLNMIGEHLKITAGSVANYLTSIKRKLGFRSITDATVHAFVYFNGYYPTPD